MCNHILHRYVDASIEENVALADQTLQTTVCISAMLYAA